MEVTPANTLRNTLTLILAGGQGERLYPLTRNRSKPSVCFGGMYRIIDFTLSNCLNSGLRRIYVLTQFRSLTLDQHIKHGWDIFSIDIDEFIYSLPPQFQVTNSWYQGTADAVYQNVYLFNIHRPERVLILSGDHVCRMDYRPMLDFHRQRGADVTVSAIETSLEEARRYGIMRINPEGRIIGFQEKPVHPIPIPGKPDRALCNMGVYVFETDALVRAVMVDAKESAHHDFGKDVLPRLVKDGARIYAYNYQEAQKNAYWRDIGTLDSYFEASMDLVSANPLFNLHDPDWLIRTYPRQFPPAKTVFAEEHAGGRFGTALHSLVSPGCIISGGKVVHSVLSYNVRINSYALVTESILLEGVSVGRHTHLRRCVVDEGAKIPDNVSIGLEAKDDGAHFTVTDSGVVVVPSNYQWH